MPYQPNLNFKLSNGTDLGNLGWITKEYLMTVYPQIANQLITPELWVWGQNYYGQLGTNTVIANISTPVTTFAGGANWKQVAGADQFTAAIKTDGTLWTWGRNSNGRLGIGEPSNPSIIISGTMSTNDSVFYADDLQGLTLGNMYDYIYVGNNQGDIDMDDLFYNYFPYDVSDIDTVNNTITFSSATYIGAGFTGSLSFDMPFNPVTKITPVTTFAGGTNWKQVAGGGSHTAAIKTDGTLWTWGSNSFGQLGDDTFISKSIPVTTFAGGTNWKQVACGFDYTSAIKTDGTLWTWGQNYYGQLGDNTTTTYSPTPVTTFAGGTNWKQVAGGGSHTAAIKTDGTLWTWGRNDDGQLGNNTTTDSPTPITTFSGGTNWKQVSSGSGHTAAIKTDGTLWSWGDNINGQLGDDTLDYSKPTPVTTFAGGTNWKQVACGLNHTAAIKTDGTLWGWGFNYTGELGNDTYGFVFTPITTFSGGTNWKQVAGGGNHTVAIKTSDDLQGI
jgi:alpha-tubulin suppressor-like RCC1 family protein